MGMEGRKGKSPQAGLSLSPLPPSGSLLHPLLRLLIRLSFSVRLAVSLLLPPEGSSLVI